MCKFFNECLISGNGCRDNCSGDDCDEYSRREKLAEELCPIMKQLGYKPELSKCNIVFIKALLPADMKCCQGNECIPAIKSELRPELKSIITECFDDLRFHKNIKPRLQKVKKMLTQKNKTG